MTTTIEKCAGGAAGVRPLLSAGRRVVVDGHAICAECGGAVEPVGPDRWRHGLSRRPRITPAAQDYAGFARRFPWVTASEDEWRQAAGVFAQYKRKLSGGAKRRALSAGQNPCLELFRLLMGSPPRLLDLEERRRELASLYSWAIPSEAALELLARHAPLVECGAGTGYWLALLRARGVDAIGYDRSRPGKGNAFHRRTGAPWTAITRLDSVRRRAGIPGARSSSAGPRTTTTRRATPSCAPTGAIPSYTSARGTMGPPARCAFTVSSP